MLRKIALIYLSTLVLAKCSSAHPVRGHVNIYALNEYRKVCSGSIENARKIFVSVEHELTAMPQKSDNMQELTDHISTLLKQIGEYQTMNDEEPAKAFLEGVLFSDIIGFQAPYRLNNEDKSMQELLDRHKMNEFLSSYERDLDGFLQKLTKMVEEYINSLSNGEKGRQQALIDWFNSLKRIKEVPQKFMLFSYFLRRFPEV